MATKKQYDDFGDAGLEEVVRPFLGGQLQKSKDDIDIEAMLQAMEVLEARARRMNKVQLHRLQTKVGTAVGLFHDAVIKYICRPRGGKVNSGKLEKVHGDSMQNAGLDADRQIEVPVVGTPEKFVKTKKETDAFGEELKK
jgi:hypothetical protein